MTSKICLALDDMDPAAELALAQAVGWDCYALKVNSAFCRSGPQIIRDFINLGAKCWVDLKVHDISNTAKNSVRALAENGASIITVHVSGGVKMMQMAVEAVRDYDCEIFAVTLLTSLDPDEIAESYGTDRTPKQIVINYALMAKRAGVHGLVCSAEEVGALHAHHSLRGMKLIVPGIRSPGADVHDQKRVGTPRQAIDDGASLLVVGREVTEAKDPVLALRNIEAQITAPQRKVDDYLDYECFDSH